MKKAVIYGSGNIGRGVIGQLFHMSGYETTFIDINKAVIDRLNTDGRYPIYVTNGDTYIEYIVTNVRGVDGEDTDAVAEAVANAEIMATAIGVNALRFIATPIARGVAHRMKKESGTPLSGFAALSGLPPQWDLSRRHIQHSVRKMLLFPRY